MSTADVAVVAEPSAGWDALPDYGGGLLDVEAIVRHRFTPSVTDGLPEFEVADAYLLSTAADWLSAHRFRPTLVIPLVKFLLSAGGVWVILRLLFDLDTTLLGSFSGLLGAAL